MDRSKASALGLTRYQGQPCKCGSRERFVSNRHCVVCIVASDKSRIESKRSRNRRWYEGNKSWFRNRNVNRVRAGNTPLAKAFKAETVRIYAKRPRGKDVDHIVPLRGLDPLTKAHVVCGLHVPWNLEYKTVAANARKWAWWTV